MSEPTVPSIDQIGPLFQLTSLTGQDRVEIVALSADRNIPGSARIPATRFDLSALGADVDLDGSWDAEGFGLNEWRHVATGGRDQYVKVVYRGYLFPLGHRAVIVKVVERVLYDDLANPTSWSNALLRLQTFIKVVEPVKSYPAEGQPFASNDWPFTSVEMKTLVSPPLDQPPAALYPTSPPIPADPQLVRIASLGADVQWSCVATDADGREVVCSAPQAFCFGEDPIHGYLDEHAESTTAPFASAYNGLAAAHRTVGASGSIKYAPDVAHHRGATVHPTIEFVLAAATPSSDPMANAAPATPASIDDLQGASQPAFYPVIASARIRLPAADTLSRGPLSDGGSPTGGVAVAYDPNFVVGGPADPANPGAVYARLSAANLPVAKFPGDAVGGICTPSVALSGLSAAAGAFAGDVDAYRTGGSLRPDQYFDAGKPALAQLLGGLPLSGILGAFTTPEQVPTVSQSLDAATGARTITYTLEASLDAYPATNSIFEPDAGGTMVLTSTTTIVPGEAPSSLVTGTISPFTVHIAAAGTALNFLDLHFERLEFTSKAGGKPNIRVELTDVAFEGALQFVNDLEKFLQGLGGSGFNVAVSHSEVKASSSVGLPSIDVGIVSLDNLRLSSSVEVPFLGNPALATFSFAAKEHPFLVTVAMFGGGGYITLVVGMSKVRTVSASIEFAGNFSVSLGVASGGLTLAAGLTYHYDSTNGMGLTGFVRLNGELEVLGVISVSCEMDLTLTWQQEAEGPNVVTGSATMSASVHVLFFSVTVPITIHKQFAGSSSAPPAGSDALVVGGLRPAVAGATLDGGPVSPSVAPPSFRQLIPNQPTWSEYCLAFHA